MLRFENRHEGFLYYGIQPFMDGNCVTDEKDLEKYDVVFLWIPLDAGVTYRRWAMNGPKTMREYSFLERVDGKEFFDTETETYLRSNELAIADYGNVFCIPSDMGKTQDNISDAVRKIREKAFPVVVWGDHSVAYWTIRGCYEALPENLKKDFAVLHLDAHLDTEEHYEWVPEIFHGNPFRKLIEEGIVKGENLYSVGMRGLISKAQMDFTIENGVRLYTVPNIRKRGFDAFSDELIGKLREHAAIYVTFDIDSIDPSEANGTGTPMENGLRAHEVQRLFRKLKALPIVGFELVEVAPEFDSSSLTTIVATNCLWNFLAFWLGNNGRLP